MMVANVRKITGAKKSKQKTDKRLSKANYAIDVHDEVWQLDANKSLNFKLLASLNLDPKFEKNFRLALADYACEFSSSYIYSLLTFLEIYLALE